MGLGGGFGCVRRGPGDCRRRYPGVGRVGQLPESLVAVLAAAMSYTGGPGRVGVGRRVGRDRDVPEPHRALPHLPRGLDAALSAVTKWRRGPIASGSPLSRLGVSVLCACG